ncbi:MAG: T9SS type A sorting domain-containing protein [Bacteroidota bacterium]|nr:T9SS type A sorting domain-containing protein [Bacteroidota bacterium]
MPLQKYLISIRKLTCFSHGQRIIINYNHKPVLYTIYFILYTFFASAQTPYNKQITLPLYKTVYNIDTLSPTFNFQLFTLNKHKDDEPEDTTGYYNKIEKKKTIAKYYGEDMQAGKIYFDSPQVVKKFAGNQPLPFTPTDNSIAASNGNIVISCINSSIFVFDTIGKKLLEKNFSAIINDPTLTGHYCYDPRIVYDHTSQRFVIALLYGNKPTNSNLVILTSVGANDYNNWHIYKYKIAGNWPSNWLDYPSLAINSHDIFVSGNLFDANNDFVSSVIFQIGKTGAYSGQPLQINLRGSLSGSPFNLVPVYHPASVTYDNYMYFLSNIAAGGDKLSIYKIKTPADNSDVVSNTLTIDRYSPPIDALQKNSTIKLDQGRCRIRDAFWQNGIIHSVFVSKDANNFGKLYYIRFDAGNNIATWQTFGLGSVDYAYPVVCPFTNDSLNQTSLISFLASGQDRFPECRAVICDNDFVFSSSTLIRKGDNSVKTSAAQNNVDRWGDYTGNVFVNARGNGHAWMAAAFGNSSQSWSTYIAKIGRPQDTAQTIIPQNKLTIYPNPMTDIATIEFDAGESNIYTLDIITMDGKRIDAVWNATVFKDNKYILQFDKSPLAPGIYIIVLHKQSGKEILRQKIVVLSKG